MIYRQYSPHNSVISNKDITVLKIIPIISLIPLLLFASSCTSHGKELALYTVSNMNFDNILHIDGFTEPVQSTTLVCPNYVDGVVVQLVEDGTYVEEGEIVCVVEYAELQNFYDQLCIDLENTKADLNKTKADIEMEYAILEAQVKNNQAETQIAQLDSLQLEYATASQKRIKELELQKVAIEKAKYEKKLQALAIIQQSEIRKQELLIQQLSNRAQTIKERLDKLTLKAPRKGLVTRSIYRISGKKLQIGDPVWGNMQLIDMPDLSKMKVIIWAPERDYKLINVDDSVYYTFDALPENISWGKILKKSPVGQPHKEGSKVKIFEIEASIDSTLIMPDPGFTASCHIVLKQVKDTIVIPQIAVFEEDSIKVVYVKKNSGYEMRQILQGIASPKNVIVTAGLERKEIISLTKPKASLVKEKVLLTDSIVKQNDLNGEQIDPDSEQIEINE